MLAYQCFKLAIINDNNHAEAYNNLGVLEWHYGREEHVILHYALVDCVLQYSSLLRPFLVLILVKGFPLVVTSHTITLQWLVKR